MSPSNAHVAASSASRLVALTPAVAARSSARRLGCRLALDNAPRASRSATAMPPSTCSRLRAARASHHTINGTATSTATITGRPWIEVVRSECAIGSLVSVGPIARKPMLAIPMWAIADSDSAAPTVPADNSCVRKYRALTAMPPTPPGVTRFAAAAANCTSSVRPSGNRRPAAADKATAEQQ